MACVWGVRFFFFSRFKRSVGIIPGVHKSVEREIRRVLPLEMRSFFLILFITTRCICYLFCVLYNIRVFPSFCKFFRICTRSLNTNLHILYIYICILRIKYIKNKIGKYFLHSTLSSNKCTTNSRNETKNIEE